jgi:hypothetical protein
MTAALHSKDLLNIAMSSCRFGSLMIGCGAACVELMPFLAQLASVVLTLLFCARGR